MSNKAYKVGKNCPPKEHQWKKGQSGNPSGKKKSPDVPQELLALFVHLLATPVQVMNGKKSSMPLLQAFVTKTLHEAMLAPLPQKLKALVFLEKIGVFDLHKLTLREAEYEEDGGWITEEDRRLLEIARSEIDADDLN